MNYAESKEVLEAIKVLERLEASGEIRPAEQRALDKFRQEKGAAEREVRETNAGYRGMARGATLGLRDEAAGAISALRGDGYVVGRDDVRAKDAAAQLLHPRQFAKGEIAGAGAISLLPGLGAIKGTKNMGAAGKAGWGLLTGALTGGGYGFNTGEGGFVPRLQNAAMPAAVGAGLGLLSPAIGAGAGALARGFQNSRRSIPGYSARGTNAVVRPINRELQAGTDVNAIMSFLGDEGMLADIPGAPRRAAQGLATIPGEGGSILTRALNERSKGASGRIQRDVNEVMGAPDAAFVERRALEADRAHRLGPEYEAALAVTDPVDVNPISDALLTVQKDAASRVSAKAKSIQRDLGITIKDGKVSVPDNVSATKLHNVRSDLSDDIEEARRQGRTKFVNQMQPILRALDERLDDLPGYANARTGYANNKAMEDAMDDGRKVFAGGATTAQSPRELEEELAKMSPAQREAFKKGAREWVAALMGTSRNDAAAAVREINKGFTQDKIRILFGQQEGDRIINRIKAEETFSQARGDINLGSQTQMRAESAKDLADLQPPDGSVRPGPVRRGVNALNAAGNSAIDSLLYAGRGAANADAGRLLSMQGAERDALLPLLLQEAMLRQTPTRGQKITGGLLDLALRGGSGAAAPVITNN